MHKPLADKLSALLTTATRDAIRSRRLDPARVPFKVHVAERVVNGVILLGVSFSTLHARAQIRSAFWNAVARLPFGLRALTFRETGDATPSTSAEHVAAFEAATVLRALLGEERYGALTVEDVHLLLGSYKVEEREREEGEASWWRVMIPAGHGRVVALGGALFESEAAARKVVKERCERLLDGSGIHLVDVDDLRDLAVHPHEASKMRFKIERADVVRCSLCQGKVKNRHGLGSEWSDHGVGRCVPDGAGGGLPAVDETARQGAFAQGGAVDVQALSARVG